MNTIKELEKLLDDPISGLKDSSDTNKMRTRILTIFGENSHNNFEQSVISFLSKISSEVLKNRTAILDLHEFYVKNEQSLIRAKITEMEEGEKGET